MEHEGGPHEDDGGEEHRERVGQRLPAAAGTQESQDYRRHESDESDEGGVHPGRCHDAGHTDGHEGERVEMPLHPRDALGGGRGVGQPVRCQVDDLVGKLDDQRIVGGHDDGNTLPGSLCDGCQDGFDVVGVEPHGGLVEDEQIRLLGQGRGNGETALLPTRERHGV